MIFCYNSPVDQSKIKDQTISLNVIIYNVIFFIFIKCACNYIVSTEIEECQSMPCRNGGTCKDLVGSYTCECVPGYTDQQCETGRNIHSKQ